MLVGKLKREMKLYKYVFYKKYLDFNIYNLFILQVNYQTVVGWQRQKVLMLFQESPPDVLLTLKKRPKHTKIYGQIYMKPYRYV